LVDVQLANSGNYFVSITNLYGSTNSATAILTVNPPPPCYPVPANIVAWWRGESNTLDTIAGNNRTLYNGIGFINGEVGTAFNFNGVNNLLIANPAAPSSLDVGQGSGLMIEGWIRSANIFSPAMIIVQYEAALGTGNGANVGVIF